MSLAMAIRDRLRAELVPATLKMVEGAAEWAGLSTPPPAARTPCAYVLPASFEPGQNGLAGGAVRQNVTRTAAVMIVASNLRDARGAAAAMDLDALLGAVITALHGWKPSEAETAMLLGAGELLDASGGLVVWQQQFTSERLFSKV
jgi:hypothetical protein